MTNVCNELMSSGCTIASEAIFLYSKIPPEMLGFVRIKKYVDFSLLRQIVHHPKLQFYVDRRVLCLIEYLEGTLIVFQF